MFLAAPGDEQAQVELTHNWDPETYGGGRNFGHLAYAVEDIYADVPAPDGARRHDQPAAPRRPHGLRPLAGQYFRSNCCSMGGALARGALDEHAEYGRVVKLAGSGRAAARP